MDYSLPGSSVHGNSPGKNTGVREQDGRGVGGCGAHLPPQIHQEYSLGHRSACRTPAESGQEDLTGGKEYVEPRKTQ